MSIESEYAVVGCLLVDSETYWAISPLVRAEDFYSPLARQVYQVAQRLIENNKPVDPITVCNESDLHLADVGAIATGMFITSNAEQYAKAVREASRKRVVAETLKTALNNLQSKKLDEIVSGVQVDLESALSISAGKDQVFEDVLRESLLAAEDARKSEKNGVVGISTGLSELDGYTGGIYGPRLWCVAARPGQGKTAMTLQWALHAANTGGKVGICSLEMGADELGCRAFAHLLRVNVTAFAHGDDYTLGVAVRNMEKTDLGPCKRNIHVDTQTFSLGGIVSRITEWKRKHAIDYAIIDHIGLIEVEGYSNRNDQLGQVSRTLKKLCKRLDIPIIAVSQLSRALEKEHRKPRLSDLRDSGNIEQDIDIGVFIHANTDEDAVALGILKNRKGKSGWLPAPVFFNGATQTFTTGGGND